MIEIIQKFQQARAKFKIIGVLGMSASGTTRFIQTAQARPFLTSTQLFGFGEMIKKKFDVDSDQIIQIFASSSQPIQLEDDGDILLTPEIKNNFIDLMIARPDIFENLNNIIAPMILDELTKVLDNAVERYSSLNNTFKVPFFIELPVTTNLNYRDIVDELVFVKRPALYDQEAWYVKYKKDECADLTKFDFCFQSIDQTKDFLNLSDQFFDKAISTFTPDHVVNNLGSEQEFIDNIFVYLDTVAAQIMNNN